MAECEGYHALRARNEANYNYSSPVPIFLPPSMISAVATGVGIELQRCKWCAKLGK